MIALYPLTEKVLMMQESYFTTIHRAFIRLDTEMYP